jgi:exopolysaccharide biosynthesis polyprenyl glycosylphosphotransferase
MRVPRRKSARGRREGREAALFAVADSVCIYGSFLAAYWVRCLSGWFPTYLPLLPVHFTMLGGLTLVMLLLFSLQGLYKPETMMSVLDQLIGLFNAVSLGILLLLAAAFLFKTEYFVERRLVLGFAWVFSLTTLSIARVFILRRSLVAARGSAAARARVLVVGAGEGGADFARQVRENPAARHQIVGFLDDDAAMKGTDVEGIPVIGTTDEIVGLAERHDIDEIFLAVTRLRQEESIELLSKCMRAQIPVKLVSDTFRLMASEATIKRIDGIPTLSVRESPMRGPALAVKRLLDVIVAALLLVVFLPLFLVIGGLIKFLSPGPVLFKQKRAGQYGKEFEFYKFRTMRADTDDRIHREYAGNFIKGKGEVEGDGDDGRPVYKMTRDPRITAVGRVLRRTSLDELPQLINILRGEMSLVGPRPPIVYELSHYKEWHKRRLEAKPGLTGLWQVSGRSRVPFNEMVLMDLYYIDNWSLWIDFEILMRTVPVILFGKGAY